MTTKVKPKIKWHEVGERLVVVVLALLFFGITMGIIIGVFYLMSLIPYSIGVWLLFSAVVVIVAIGLFYLGYYLLYGHDFSDRKMYYTYEE